MPLATQSARLHFHQTFCTAFLPSIHTPSRSLAAARPFVIPPSLDGLTPACCLPQLVASYHSLYANLLSPWKISELRLTSPGTTAETTSLFSAILYTQNPPTRVRSAPREEKFVSRRRERTKWLILREFKCLPIERFELVFRGRD